MAPHISIILVNYNGFTDTIECIKSIKRSNYDNYSIIVVDNASTTKPDNEQMEFLNNNCDFVSLKENIGFAGGNNVGIKFAEKYNSDYYLLLNNDTIVESNFLIPLIEQCENNPKIGIATGKILYYDQPNLLWFGGSYYDNKLCECRIDGIGKAEKKCHNECKFIPFATGCMFLISAQALKDAGYMAEDYFLYYEDADYCERIKNLNYKIKYIPQSVIYHKESRSTNKGSSLYSYYVLRNYLIFIRKYAKGKSKAGLYLRRFYISLKNVIRKRTKFKTFFYAWKDFVFHKSGKCSYEL